MSNPNPNPEKRHLNLTGAGKGRRFGARATFGKQFVQDMQEAYTNRGGIKFLQSLPEKDFTMLLSKVIPRDVALTIEGKTWVEIMADGVLPIDASGNRDDIGEIDDDLAEVENVDDGEEVG